jgi:hypothetical protein
MGEEGGVNLYGFVGNSGIDRFDRFGLEEEVDLAGAAGAVFKFIALVGKEIVNEVIEYRKESKPANDQFDKVLRDYIMPGGNTSYHFDQDAPWTQALMKRPVYDRMRAFLEQMAKESCADRTLLMGHMGKWDYSADDAPLIQPLWDATNYIHKIEVQSLGSNDGTWLITGVDCGGCTMTYEMVVEDKFRFGSNFRIPQRDIGLPDNPFGFTGSFGTVDITWTWEESLNFN